MLNPVNTTLEDKIKELERKVNSLSNTTQPPLLSWVLFNASSATYTGTGAYITLTGAKAAGYSFGDKVWIVTDANDNFYFYVTDVLENSIELSPSRNSPAINASFFSTYTISKIYFSKLPAPYGFVSQQDAITAARTANMYVDTGTLTPSTTSLNFTILGNNTVIIRLDAIGLDASNAWNEVAIDLPIPTDYMTRTPLVTFDNTFGYNPIILSTPSGNIMGYTDISTYLAPGESGLGEMRLIIRPASGSVAAGITFIYRWFGYQFDTNFVYE